MGMANGNQLVRLLQNERDLGVRMRETMDHVHDLVFLSLRRFNRFADARDARPEFCWNLGVIDQESDWVVGWLVEHKQFGIAELGLSLSAASLRFLQTASTAPLV
jgi:hypothetical protein